MPNYIGEVKFPSNFTPLDAVQPALIPLADSWLISVYGAFTGQEMCQYVFHWRPGQIAAVVPLQKLCSARGSMAVAGGETWLFAWHKEDRTSRVRPKLVWQNVPHE